jgi:hypothetical protein
MQYLVDRCRVEMIGATQAMILLKLYDTLNEFFNDSSIWQEVLAGNFIGNITRYYLVPQHEPAGVIIRLDGVYDYNGFGVPSLMPEPPFLQLAYPANQPNPAYVRVVKTCAVPPLGEAPHVPYWVFDQYEPYLFAGLMSKMQIQPDRPYTDVKAAQVNHYKFREGVMNARVNALRRNTFGRNTWVYPQQFRTTSQQGGVSVGNAFNEF